MLLSDFTNTSETAKFLITLLSNAEDLISLSNKRKDAQDVMKAFQIYAKGKAFPIPEDKVGNFSAILYDARPNTLSYLLRSIAGDVHNVDRKRLKAVRGREKKHQVEQEEAENSLAETDVEPSEE